ncbi:MAG: cysteine--tRNA ligase [Gemmatimonadetes bacterium]|nr:cysteine--tRNA ligase [Gemmatimonadota bacterium]
MTLRLYNTMTRSVEDFVPLQAPHVSLYTCGPTVYNYAHIGNFRTFLFEDVLRRWLAACGFDVFHVMNLTDVDDKTIRGAAAAGASLADHVVRFIDAFREDCGYLRLLPAHVYPRATEYVAPMIALVESLLAKGVAYKGDDGSVYFAIARYPAYGKLSRLDTRELQAGAGGRTLADEYAKEDARDFVLWKAARDEDEAVGAAWDAPFGRGRPGWHLECSAMALDLIGKQLGTDVLDIHAGGIDLVFPHHEDEIAQSCAHTGKPDFARVWMHGEFLTMAGTKMSKRFGNILTARDLREEKVDAGTVRLLLATTHYRAPLDFTDQALDSAREGSRRLGAVAARLAQLPASAGSPAYEAVGATLAADFATAMNDDLNTPRALAALFEAAREGNRLLDAGEQPGPAFRAAWAKATDVLQVLPTPAAGFSLPATGATSAGDLEEAVPADQAAQQAWALGWAGRRLTAKQTRNFAEADRIRGLLAEAGWDVRDNRDGTAEVQRR